MSYPREKLIRGKNLQGGAKVPDGASCRVFLDFGRSIRAGLFIWFHRIFASSHGTGVMGCTGDDVAQPGMRRLVVEASQPSHGSFDRLGRARQSTEHKVMRSFHVPGDIERKHRYQVGRRQDLRRRQECARIAGLGADFDRPGPLSTKSVPNWADEISSWGRLVNFSVENSRSFAAG